MLKEISKTKSLIKVIDFVKESTRIGPKSSCEDIETLDFKERNGSLVIDYTYQRNYIQSLESASAYVESIFLGLIIPEIQIFEDYNTGQREIIDGQQRTLSLLKFYRGEYALTKLKELPELNGFYFKDLPLPLQNIIKGFQLNIRTFTNEDIDYKYVMFERLNTGAKKLNSQEVRNCMFRGEMLDKIKEISGLDSVAKLFKHIKNNRFERDEFVSSLLALMYFLNTEDGKQFRCGDKMKKRINDFLEQAKNFEPNEMAFISSRFLELTEFIAKYIDVKDISSYMYSGGPISAMASKSIYESLYVAFDREDLSVCRQNIRAILPKLYDAFNSEEYKETLGSSSSKSLPKVTTRIEKVHESIHSAITENEAKKKEETAV